MGLRRRSMARPRSPLPEESQSGWLRDARTTDDDIIEGKLVPGERARVVVAIKATVAPIVVFITAPPGEA